MLNTVRAASFCAAALVAAVPLRASAAPAWAYKTSAGDRLRYKLDYRSKSELNFGGLTKAARGGGDADTQKVNVGIKGDLEVTTIAASENGATLAVAVVNPAVKMDSEGEDESEAAAAVAANLAKPAFVQVDTHGKVLGVRFDKDVDADAQLPMRALLSIAQFVLPAGDATPKTWTADEVEPNGSYVARYTQAGKDADGVRTVKKRKLSFAEETSAESAHEIAVKKTIKAQGDLAFRFDVAKGRLTGINGEETQSVLLNGKAIGRAATRIRLTLRDAKKLSADELSPLAQAHDERAKAGPLLTLKTIENKAAAEQTIAEGELKNTDADKLFAELRKLEEGSGEEQPLYLKLKALFQLQPQTAARAGEILGKAKSDGASVRVLSGALGTVGNDQCQAALAAAAKARPENDPALAAILPAMGELTSPLAVVEEALRLLALGASDGEGASTARLALGTMASTLGKSAPDRSKKIVTDLAALEEKAPNDEIRRQLLLALGNSGSAEALPALGRAVASKNPDLREAAAKALGQVKSPEADKLLHSLEKDADDHVRKAAADSLANRKGG